VNLALRRWSGSFDRESNEDSLIDYWIGLEALFTPDTTTELRFRAAMRIAAFLGQTADERSSVFKGVKTSYDWRSAIVHGSSDKQIANLSRNAPLPAVAGQTRDYLRQTLTDILDGQRLFRPEDFDDLLLRGEIAPQE